MATQRLTERIRMQDADDLSTLTTRYNRADWRGRAGDPAAAVTDLERLLKELGRVRGPNCAAANR